MFPIISVAVHPLVHMITGFTNILFSTLGACNKVDNIGLLTTGVAPKLDLGVIILQVLQLALPISKSGAIIKLRCNSV